MGTGLSAGNAQNCEGISGSGTGLSAANAQNCDGSSGGGTGLSAVGIAANCTGEADGSGPGVSAYQAENCYGYSLSGIGLKAIYGNFSFGYGSQNVLIYVSSYNMPP
jgi:hypothetical protein